MPDRKDLARPPGMAPGQNVAGGPAGSVPRRELEAFLAAARRTVPHASGRRGRLVFALDATMSRQPTWDAACALQAELFRAADRAGGLSVQLAYFRGQGEARASRWVDDAEALRRLMVKIACHGGLTQIGRILDHVADEAARSPIAALAYVGDAMEENIDVLCDKAARLAMRNVRAFMFLEGGDPAAERAYREIARITRGVMLPFDRTSADELRELLGAVATYAAGGRPALEAERSAAARKLLSDLGR